MYLIKIHNEKISLHCGVSNVKSIFCQKTNFYKVGVLIAIWFWGANLNAIFTAQILHLAQNVKLGGKEHIRPNNILFYSAQIINTSVFTIDTSCILHYEILCCFI